MCAGPTDCAGRWCSDCIPTGYRIRNPDGSWTLGDLDIECDELEIPGEYERTTDRWRERKKNDN